MQHQGGPHDLVAEVTAEIRTGSEVDVSAEELRQFEFDRSYAKESGQPIGEKVDEQIDVAVGAQLVAESRAVESELPDPVSGAECREGIVVNVDPCGEHHTDILARVVTTN